MKLLPLVLAASLAAVTVTLPGASAAECIVGDNEQKCVVSVTMVVCVTEPCDGIIVCVGHGLACSNRLP